MFKLIYVYLQIPYKCYEIKPIHSRVQHNKKLCNFILIMLD